MEKIISYLEESKSAKKGITFYVNGNTINGYVVNINKDNGTIEVRNQTTSKILIFVDKVDAIGLA